MVIVKLIGGLGNQLFQYALARQIAETNRAVLKLDISGFETYTLHKYSLRAFNIQERFATPEEVKALTTSRLGTVRKLLLKVAGIAVEPALLHIREKDFLFNPEILKLPDGVYLDGYWQSEKYFSGIEDIIRKEFTVKIQQRDKDKELTEQISACESVSLHVRRKDYVTDLKTSEVHGTCGTDYYLFAVEKLMEKVREPHFFVFSDDPEWVRNNMKLSYPMTLVDHNTADKNYEDLRLMSHCKHHIIANSSFSWWGAWLCRNPDKIVIAPQKWFNKRELNPADLIPEKWIKI